jgi:Ca2+-binding RTX toxin-like protein
MEGLHQKKKEKQMRRTIALLTTMAMTLLVATSVAMAVTKTCSYSGACDGTTDPDKLYGREGNNNIYGYGGDDDIYGKSGDDYLFGYAGEDDLYGDLYGDVGAGPPNGGVGGGDDYMSGGSDFDRLYGGSGDDRMYGGDGSDLYVGGGGNDIMVSQDKLKNNIYRFDFRPELDIGTAVPSGSDQVTDSGGTNDILWWTSSNTTRDAVLITWVDTSDADGYRDAMRVRDKDQPTQSVLVYNYFNNLGGYCKGPGAIEFLHFADKTFVHPGHTNPAC